MTAIPINICADRSLGLESDLASLRQIAVPIHSPIGFIGSAIGLDRSTDRQPITSAIQSDRCIVLPGGDR